MAITANYPTPVYVNGYACNNCAQVAEAKQDINPADPQAGPWGIDANSAQNAGHGPAFTFGGALAPGASDPPSNADQTAPTGASSTSVSPISASSTQAPVGGPSAAFPPDAQTPPSRISVLV